MARVLYWWIPRVLMPSLFVLLAAVIWREHPSFPTTTGVLVAIGLLTFWGGSHDQRSLSSLTSFLYAVSPTTTSPRLLAVAYLRVLRYYLLVPAAAVGAQLLGQHFDWHSPWVPTIAAAVAYLIARSWSRPPHEPRADNDDVLPDQHMRGRKLNSMEDVLKKQEELLNKSAAPHPTTGSAPGTTSPPPSRRDPGIPWGGARLPTDAAKTHFAVCGTTGSGKTITLRLLMQHVLPQIANPLLDGTQQTRALIFDPKTEFLPHFKGMELQCPVAILHPFDARSAGWHMADDLRDPASAKAVADILIPVENEREPFYPNAARHILSSVLLSLITTCPQRWTLRDVLWTLDSQPHLQQLLGRIPQTAHVLEQYGGSQETFANLRATFAEKLANFGPIAAAWHRAKSRISLRHWLSNEYILLLGHDEAIRPAMTAVNRLLFHRLSQLMLSPSLNKEHGPQQLLQQTWVILDEVRELGRLDGLASLLLRGRGANVCVALGFQDIEGLREVYGEKVANELTGQCNNKACLRLNSRGTADWVAGLIGEEERREFMQGVTKTENTGYREYGDHRYTGPKSSVAHQQTEHRNKRHAVMPEQLLDLPPTNQRNGLTGYYLSAEYGVFRSTLKGDELFGRMLWKDGEGVPTFVPRSEDDQYLIPWDAQDLRRLAFGAGFQRPEGPSIFDIPRLRSQPRPRKRPAAS